MDSNLISLNVVFSMAALHTAVLFCLWGPCMSYLTWGNIPSYTGHVWSRVRLQIPVLMGGAVWAEPDGRSGLGGTRLKSLLESAVGNCSLPPWSQGNSFFKAWFWCIFTSKNNYMRWERISHKLLASSYDWMERMVLRSLLHETWGVSVVSWTSLLLLSAYSMGPVTRG